jgi:Uma2 family endonuclease
MAAHTRTSGRLDRDGGAVRWKLTVDQYQRMGETGILGPEDRVELLDGELFAMPPIGDGHEGKTIRLNRLFARLLGDRVLISVQNPVRLNDYSEPQPDLVLLRPRPDFYETAKPRPPDVLLAVEVADSSLAYDRTKVARYAAAGIAEAWIVNLRDRLVEVFRAPAPAGYRERAEYRAGDRIALVALPDVTIEVEQIVG